MCGQCTPLQAGFCVLLIRPQHCLSTPDFLVQQDSPGNVPQPGFSPFYKEPWFLLVEVALTNHDMGEWHIFLFIESLLK